jgi:branched-chain amino acid aminotransferase
VLEGIDSGRCGEMFACGTAAVVSPISVLAEGDGREYKLRQTDVVAKHLREALLAIQERRAPDPFGWTRELAPG